MLISEEAALTWLGVCTWWVSDRGGMWRLGICWVGFGRVGMRVRGRCRRLDTGQLHCRQEWVEVGDADGGVCRSMVRSRMQPCVEAQSLRAG